MISSKRNMPPLTGMRFFLAIWVVIYHQSSSDLPWVAALDMPRRLESILHSGYAAVSIFFVLSGFVLAHNYDLGAAWSSREVSRFAIARFSRIYPAYFLGLLLMAPFVVYRLVNEFSPGGGAGEAILAFLNFTLLQAWIPQTALTWNHPGWSLSNEAFFYACFPIVGVLLWRASRPRAFAALAILLWALSVAGPLWAVLRPVPGFGDLPATTPMAETSSMWTNIIRYNPLVRLPEFCMGILAGRIFSWAHARGARMDGRGYWLYLPAIAIALLFLSEADRIPYPLVHNGLLLPVYACIVLGFAFSGGTPARWLSSGLLVFLGNASYSMYILHVPIASWLGIFWKRVFVLTPEGLVWLLLYASVVVVMASLTFKFIEEPSHYYLKKLLNRRLDEWSDYKRAAAPQVTTLPPSAV